MLLRNDTLLGIRKGKIDLVFRRWRKPAARAGGTQLSRGWQLEFTSVKKVSARSVTDAHARRAGYPGRAALLAELQRFGEGSIFRIGIRLKGRDPRIALRKNARLSKQEIAALLAKLAKLDRLSGYGPWTRATLRAIAREPGRRAPDLAAKFGRETKPFKIDVRKLKKLGLTESLPVGYRISPRGKVVLKALG